MRVLHINKRMAFFRRCPITAVVGKYNVSFICQRIGNVFECQMAYTPANYAGKYNFFARIKLSVKFLVPLSLFYSCLAKVNAKSVSIDSKGYTTKVKLCLEFIGKECFIYIIKSFRKEKFHKICGLASDL